jgi:hypothetical protein
MTNSLRDEFKELNCTTSYIPGGCTGFVQVLDVSLNKALKALVTQQASNHADKYHDRYEAGDFTVANRRVLLTKWVAEAWKELHEKYKDVIIKTFRSVGLSLNPDGSEDSELKVKGLPDIAVGDYAQKEPEEENGLGSLTAVDIAAVKAAQVCLAARVAKTKAKKDAQRARNNTKVAVGRAFPLYEDDTAEGYDPNNLIDVSTGLRDPMEESSDEDGEHEEIFTLGRMNTRSQTRVSRYFTHTEVEADIEEARALVELQEGPSNDEEPTYDTTDDEEFDENAGGDEDTADENM